MSSVPWSDKALKAVPVEADKTLIIDSDDSQNKQVTLGDIISSVSPASKLLLVSEQADLETQFGTDIIIPDFESWTLLVVESFTLTKPIKIGSFSTLEVTGSSINLNITYTGIGALFQNENLANPIRLLDVGNMEFIGDNTNDVFDVVAGFSIIIERSVLFTSFNAAGTWETLFFDIEFASLQGVKIGLIIKNPFGGSIRGFSLNQASSTPPVTLISILTNVASQVSVEECFSGDITSSIVFFDPNSPAGAKFNIVRTVGTFANLFAQGTDIAIDSVVDNGSGETEFTANSAHGLEVGQAVVLSGFGVQTTYNQTAIVTAISGLTFDCAITFVATDTGNLNAASLGSTDVNVSAVNNVGSQDSMFTGDSGLEIFGTEITVIINTINVPEVITSVSWAFSNLERFSIGVNNEGQLTTDDVTTRRYNVSYSGTLEKVGGGSVDVGVVLLKNGSVISFNAPHTVNTGKIQISGSDIVELTETDTIQVAVINYIDISDIDVSQVSLVVSLA